MNISKVKDNLLCGKRLHYCKRYAFFQPSTGKMYPAACKTWKCPVCAPIRAQALMEKMKALMKLNSQWYFMTLTIDPKVPSGCDLDMPPDQYTKMVWHRAHRSLSRIEKYSYLWVIEFHKKTGKDGKLNNPYPHMHFLIDAGLEKETIVDIWTRCGGGVQIDIRPAKSQNELTGYMCKYLKKEAIYTARNMLKGSRIWGRSRDLKLVSEMEKETKGVSEWAYLREYIYHTEESKKEYLQKKKEYDKMVIDIQKY